MYKNKCVCVWSTRDRRTYCPITSETSVAHYSPPGTSLLPVYLCGLSLSLSLSSTHTHTQSHTSFILQKPFTAWRRSEYVSAEQNHAQTILLSFMLSIQPYQGRSISLSLNLSLSFHVHRRSQNASAPLCWVTAECIHWRDFRGRNTENVASLSLSLTRKLSFGLVYLLVMSSAMCTLGLVTPVGRCVSGVMRFGFVHICGCVWEREKCWCVWGVFLRVCVGLWKFQVGRSVCVCKVPNVLHVPINIVKQERTLDFVTF